MHLAAIRPGWLGWQNRSALTRLLVFVVAWTVGVPALLIGIAVSALTGPAQAAEAIGNAARPMATWVVSQPFGCTGFYLEPPRGACPHFHAGIDLVAPAGTEVRAVMAGTVEISPIGGYGNHVFVHHGGDLVTLYAHLASFVVVPGQSVVPGSVLGYEGSTGASTGAHLHFEVRKSADPVDPVQVFPSLFGQEGQPVSTIVGKPAGGLEREEPE
jgi:murein DD-endopeptidase MepM/ murein hydrolase activator NlpD